MVLGGRLRGRAAAANASEYRWQYRGRRHLICRRKDRLARAPITGGELQEVIVKVSRRLTGCFDAMAGVRKLL
jgi:hypothetical protein